MSRNQFVTSCSIPIVTSIWLWLLCTPVAAGSYQVYYGHVHNHSRLSDGKGSPEKAYSYAQHVAGLDFFGLSDHAERLSAGEWERIRRVAQAHYQPGVFVTFWGFEWSHYSQGHVTVLQTDDYTSARITDTNTFAELVNWISDRNAIAIFNHPGRQDKTGAEFGHFSMALSPRFVAIELFNKTNGFDTYYYNDGYRRNDGGKGFYDEALTAGWRVGAAGSDDNHRATWGQRTDYRLAVLAPEKTRSAITDAFIARRFFSTLDKNLSLSFEICGNQMGAVITKGSCECVIRAADGDIVTFLHIMLIKNGSGLRIWHPYASAPVISTPLRLQPGEYYYVKITQSDGDEAISSPIWVTGAASPTATAFPKPSTRQ